MLGMKIFFIYVVVGLGFVHCLGSDNVSISKRQTTLAEAKRNSTALHQIKTQIYKIIDKNTRSNNLRNKQQKLDILNSEEQHNQSRIKRRTKKENLDNLLPTLSIRSVNVNLDWFTFAKNVNISQIGTVFVLTDGKNLMTHVMNLGNFGNYYTIPSLEQDRVYQGEVKILTEIQEVKNFIRKQYNEKYSEKFELTTPFIVRDDDVKKILEARELLEKKQKQLPQTIKVNYIDIKLIFSKIEKLGYIVDVSRYYSEGNTSMLSAPEQTIELLPPVKEIILSDYQPHELLRVTLKNVHEKEDDGEIFFSTVHTINIFTGSVYKMGMANFSRELDAQTVAALRKNDRVNSSAKTEHYKNFRAVKCYADDDVFSGYPCHDSDTCIPLDWVCDGEPDCKSHDDEHHCEDDYTGYDNEFPYRDSCRRYEFRCRARGESVCLPNSWLCDGRVDCTNGWDEDTENCYNLFKQLRPGYTYRKEIYNTKSCGHNYFRCWNGKDCAALRDVCDGNEDCEDGSDERICENNVNCDSESEFRCYKSQQRPVNSFLNRSCIPRSWVCDDQEDCPNGEDESPRLCDRYNKFSFSSNILKPFGIGFEINTGLKKK